MYIETILAADFVITSFESLHQVMIDISNGYISSDLNIYVNSTKIGKLGFSFGMKKCNFPMITYLL